MDVKREISSEEEYVYKTSLKKAINQTKKMNFKVPYFCFNQSFKLNESIKKEIDNFLMEIKLEQNCGNATRELQLFLREYHSIDSLVTIGSISIKDGKKVFHTPITDLTQKLKLSFYNNFESHFWLTLPDRSIIDATIVSTFKLARKTNDLEFPIDIDALSNVLYVDTKHQGAFKSINYFPMLIGMNQ